MTTIYRNDSLFERFNVLFGKKSSIVAGKEYPMGYFAAEALEVDDVLLAELEKLTQQAGEEFDVFLTARTSSSAGMAIQKLDRAWELIRQLPLYNELPYRDGCGSVVSGMICGLRDDEQKHDRMLTTGTRENELLRRWQGRYRGMAAGHIPRRCHNCGRWFLLVGAYDTVYCRRTAPGETKRTCRQVGAHRKEQERNGREFACREYARAYNRLKTWKRRGKLSAEEWNRRVAYIQDLKEAFLTGELSDAAYRTKLERA